MTIYEFEAWANQQIANYRMARDIKMLILGIVIGVAICAIAYVIVKKEEDH